MLKHFLIIFALFISTLGFSQEEDAYVFGDNSGATNNSDNGGGFDWDRVTIGGGFYFQFGTNPYVAVSPRIGYFVTDNIVLGIGLSYVYEELNDPGFVPYTANTYTGRVYGQYIFNRMPLLLHAEIEAASIGIKYKDQFYGNETIDMINVYVGGGLKQSMGGFSYLYVMLLYNLNETKESNYIQPNPIIRIGIAIGL